MADDDELYDRDFMDAMGVDDSRVLEIPPEGLKHHYEALLDSSSKMTVVKRNRKFDQVMRGLYAHCRACHYRYDTECEAIKSYIMLYQTDRVFHDEVNRYGGLRLHPEYIRSSIGVDTAYHDYGVFRNEYNRLNRKHGSKRGGRFGDIEFDFQPCGV